MPTLFDKTATVELTPKDRMALAVVAAWGKQTWVDRLVFGQALLLWKNNKHRQHMLGTGDEPSRSPTSAGSIPQIIGKAYNEDWFEQREGSEIEFFRITDSAPTIELKNAEKKKLDEIRKVIELQRDTDDSPIEVKEDSIRATKEFVSG